MRRILLLILLTLTPASAGYVDIAVVTDFLGSRMEIVWNTDEEQWVVTFTEKELKGLSTVFLSHGEMKKLRGLYHQAKTRALALKPGTQQKDMVVMGGLTKVRFHGRAINEDLKWLEIQVAEVFFTVPLRYKNRKILDAVNNAFEKTKEIPREST